MAGHIGFEPANPSASYLIGICVTTSPEVGASLAAETLRVRAALCGFAAPAKISAGCASVHLILINGDRLCNRAFLQSRPSLGSSTSRLTKMISLLSSALFACMPLPRQQRRNENNRAENQVGNDAGNHERIERGGYLLLRSHDVVNHDPCHQHDIHAEDRQCVLIPQAQAANRPKAPASIWVPRQQLKPGHA